MRTCSLLIDLRTLSHNLSLDNIIDLRGMQRAVENDFFLLANSSSYNYNTSVVHRIPKLLLMQNIIIVTESQSPCLCYIAIAWELHSGHKRDGVQNLRSCPKEGMRVY